MFMGPLTRAGQVVDHGGAGASDSLRVSLTRQFRMVELSGGSIKIDGLDISTLGLAQLRRKLAIIPQDALLFEGTLRSNLDPFNAHTDAELWDALRRSYLVEKPAAPTVDEKGDKSRATSPVRASRFTVRAMLAFGPLTSQLDMKIEDEGSNRASLHTLPA